MKMNKQIRKSQSCRLQYEETEIKQESQRKERRIFCIDKIWFSSFRFVNRTQVCTEFVILPQKMQFKKSVALNFGPSGQMETKLPHFKMLQISQSYVFAKYFRFFSSKFQTPS